MSCRIPACDRGYRRFKVRGERASGVHRVSKNPINPRFSLVLSFSGSVWCCEQRCDEAWLVRKTGVSRAGQCNRRDWNWCTRHEMNNFRWRSPSSGSVGLAQLSPDAGWRPPFAIELFRANRARQGRAGVRVRGCRPAGGFEQPISHQSAERRSEAAMPSWGRQTKSKQLSPTSPSVTADQSRLRLVQMHVASPNTTLVHQTRQGKGAVSCKRASRRVACMPASTDESRPSPASLPVGFVGATLGNQSFGSSSPHSYRFGFWPTICLSAVAGGVQTCRRESESWEMGILGAEKIEQNGGMCRNVRVEKASLGLAKAAGDGR